MENELSTEQLKSLQTLLVNLKEKALEVTQNTSHEALMGLDQNSSEKVIDADLASESSSQDMDLKIARFESMKISEIDLALERLHKGTYGVCLECEEPISFKRLQAIPFTKFCVLCEAALEKTARSAQKGHETEVDFGQPIIKQFS